LDLATFSVLQVQLFGLVLSRVSAIFTMAPVFGSRTIPATVKIGLALLISVAIYPTLDLNGLELPVQIIPFALMVLKEFAIGMIIGFLITMIMNAAFLAGQMVDTQMGFGIANIVDPITGAQIPLIGQFQYVLALTLFLALNAHRILLGTLMESFRIVPLTMASYARSIPFTAYVIKLSSEMWVLALKIAAPALAVLFLSTVALGIVARTVPQMNVFIVGFPLQIGIGLFMVMEALPMTVIVLSRVFDDEFFRKILELLSLLRP
jgi:flagellar biosynthetic protein FliR